MESTSYCCRTWKSSIVSIHKGKNRIQKSFKTVWRFDCFSPCCRTWTFWGTIFSVVYVVFSKTYFLLKKIFIAHILKINSTQNKGFYFFFNLLFVQLKNFHLYVFGTLSKLLRCQRWSRGFLSKPLKIVTKSLSLVDITKSDVINEGVISSKIVAS